MSGIAVESSAAHHHARAAGLLSQMKSSSQTPKYDAMTVELDQISFHSR
jgi:hypothetical protein